jgi:hypothetical protein
MTIPLFATRLRNELRDETVAAVQVLVDAAEQAASDATANGAAQVALAQAEADRAEAARAEAQALVGTKVLLKLLSSDDKIDLPAHATWTSTEGAWERGRNGAWSQIAGNTERSFHDQNGVYAGALMEPARRIYGAPWHKTDAPHANTDAAYLFNNGPSWISRAYAGEHSGPDIHGGTGKGVLLTSLQNTPTNTVIRADNIGFANPALGNRCRTSMLISLPVKGSTWSFSIGWASSSVSFAVDAAGEITISSAINATRQYVTGVSKMPYQDSAGNDVWLVWAQFDGIAASTNFFPLVNLANVPVGVQMMIHDWTAGNNLEAPPSGTPQLITPTTGSAPYYKDFVAETINTDIDGKIGALFHGVARCRTAITDGKLALLNSRYMSGGDWFPLVPCIEIVASNETTDTYGILPNSTDRYDFGPQTAANSNRVDDYTLNLGPGRFTQECLPSTSGGWFRPNLHNFTLTSAFKNDVRLYGWISRLLNAVGAQTGQTNLTGLTKMDYICIFPLSSNEGELVSQTQLGTSNTHTLRPAGNFNFNHSIQLGTIPTHTRNRRNVTVQDDMDDLTLSIFQGYLTINMNEAPNGSSVNVDNSSCQMVPRGLSPNGPSGRTFTWSQENFYLDRVWNDATYLHGGTITYSTNNVFLGRSTGMRLDLMQSTKEIEVAVSVDSNNRPIWQNVTAAGLSAAADLPRGLWAYHAGVYDYTTNTLNEAAAIRGRRIMVAHYSQFFGNANQNRPNFQFAYNGMLIGNGTLEAAPDDGDVFVIAQKFAPSPTTPWVRLYCRYGTWTNNVWSNGSGPAIYNIATHHDGIQTNLADVNLPNTYIGSWISVSPTQPVFLQMNTGVFGNVTVENHVHMSSFRNQLLAKSSTNPGAPTMFSVTNYAAIPHHFKRLLANKSDQVMGLVSVDVPQMSLTLNNVWLPTRAGEENISNKIEIIGGGTLTGAHNNIGANGITAGVVTNYPGVPSATHCIKEEYLDPTTGHFDQSLIDPLKELEGPFTPYFEALTGIPGNKLWRESIQTGLRFKPLVDWLMQWQRDPDFIVTVNPATVLVGDTIAVRRFERFVPETLLETAKIKGTSWKPRYSGNEHRWVGLNGNGALVLRRSLTGVNRVFMFITNLDELILMDVQP